MLVELSEVLGGKKIDESISYVALVLDIARQVQEIIGVFEVIVDLIRQFLDCVLVRNVSDHYRCPCIVLDVLRHDQVEIALVVGLVAVIIVVCLAAVVTWLEEVEVRMGVYCACVTFRKGRVD